jgi:hypothetical protein
MPSGLGAAIAALNTTVLHYRFDVVIGRAKDLTSQNRGWYDPSQVG